MLRSTGVRSQSLALPLFLSFVLSLALPRATIKTLISLEKLLKGGREGGDGGERERGRERTPEGQGDRQRQRLSDSRRDREAGRQRDRETDREED